MPPDKGELGVTTVTSREGVAVPYVRSRYFWVDGEDRARCNNKLDLNREDFSAHWTDQRAADGWTRSHDA